MNDESTIGCWALYLLVFLTSTAPTQENEKNPLAAFQQEWAELYRKVRPAVVGITAQSSPDWNQAQVLQKGKFYGTGFFIAPGLMVSTSDVVQNRAVVLCLFYDHRFGQGEVVAQDRENRLVLIHCSRPDIAPLALTDQVQVGQWVATLGNPYGSITRVNQAAFSLGLVSGIYDLPRAGFTLHGLIETDAAVNPGIFGGPLLNRRAEVVGILFSGYHASRWLGTAIPANAAMALLAQYQVGQAAQTPGDGIAEADPIYLGAKLDPTSETPVVLEIDPESPAEEGGMRKNDRLLQIDQYKVSTTREWEKRLQTFFPRQEVVIWVLRGTQRLPLRIRLGSKYL